MINIQSTTKGGGMTSAWKAFSCYVRLVSIRVDLVLVSI
jgi:hypothetical protein